MTAAVRTFTIQYGKFTALKEYVHTELISSPLMSIISCGADFTIQYGNFYVTKPKTCITKPHFLSSEALYLQTKITILYLTNYLYTFLTCKLPKHKTRTKNTNTISFKGMGI